MKQHILHIAPTPFFADRGCHIRIEGIVRCLSELGFDNTVCTYHHGRDVEHVRTRRISPIKNYTQTTAGPSKYKLWADWKLLWLSFSEFKRHKPIALHAHLHEGLMIALILKILFFWRKTPVIADMQGSLTGELESHGVFAKWPILRWPTRTIEMLLMWLSDLIVCSSAHSLDKIKSEFKIADDKISLVQDGADAAPEVSSEHIDQLKQDLALPLNKAIAVYSGALLEAKGLNELKALILQSNSIAEQLHFLVIGYPTEELEGFLEAQGLAQTCSLTGQVEFERLAEYLRLADIAIDPKNSDAGEGSGKMLNYLACGLAIVAFDTQNNREFLPDGTALASCETQLAEQLAELVEKPELRETLAQQNLAQFTNNYSWQVSKQQLDKVYQRAFS